MADLHCCQLTRQTMVSPVASAGLKSTSVGIGRRHSHHNYAGLLPSDSLNYVYRATDRSTLSLLVKPVRTDEVFVSTLVQRALYRRELGSDRPASCRSFRRCYVEYQ